MIFNNSLSWLLFIKYMNDNSLVYNNHTMIHLITFIAPIAIVHYGIFNNSYVIQTINNHIDQNKKYDIVPTIHYHDYYLLNT